MLLFSLSLCSLESHLADLVLDLEGHQPLVVEDLANLASIELEMRLAEVHKGDDADEEDHPGIVSLALLFKGVISEFVTIRLIMHFRVLLKGHRCSVTREYMAVTMKEIEKRPLLT
jgi:hypothetical protein